MNRNVVLGCLGVAVVVILVAGTLFYLNVIRPTRAIMPDLQQLGELQAMNAEIESKEPFTPTDDQSLTSNELDRFVHVQTDMKDSLGADFAPLDAKAHRVRSLEEGDKKVRVGLRDAIRSFQGLGPLMIRAKHAQVAALNDEGFSYGEYRWVRERFYRALGYKDVGLYLEDFARNLGKGKMPAPPAAADTIGVIPPGDREMVSAYADSVKAWYPFLVFGL
jgi:hypothetical protein